jgi:antitoxin HicB
MYSRRKRRRVNLTETTMLAYPAKFTPDADESLLVTFRDIPEAITCGDTREEALAMAADALATAMEFYFEDCRPVPAPSLAEPGDELIPLPAIVERKVLLLNELLAQNAPKSEVSRRLAECG